MSSKHQQKLATSFTQGSTTKLRKSQRCTGCPGCSNSFRKLPALPIPELSSHGENKVRAWLEDVRPLQNRWKDTENAQRNFQENSKIFAKNLEYLKQLAKHDFTDPESMNLSGKSISSWQDNPPMLRTFQHITMSEILGEDDRHSTSKQSTRSMFEDSNYNRYNHGKKRALTPQFTGNDAINAKIRKAIENSFIKQMEESVAIENEKNKNPKSNKNNKNGGESAVKETSNIEKPKKHPQPLQNNPKRSKKSRAPSAPSRKELPDMINELPSTKNTAKRIMDAVIREMVDVKAIDHHATKSPMTTDYEVDSLERSKSSRKSSTSPELTDQSSPTLSTALPMDEELTMQNAVINTRTGNMTISKLNNQVLERNYYNNLPELISHRPEAYSLVSEVYVNDGYASPACSDDSGPEIQYEPENPGHLTIKVQDSPKNYVKVDESEYEPDTLDRKPMKLKINEDMHYDKEIINEVYVDSLERPAQILLKSKGSFRNDDSTKNFSLQRGHGSLREIYEAKIKSNMKECQLTNGIKSLDSEFKDTFSWKKCRYLTPDNKHAKRQQQPHNQPDVVPLPSTEEIYQRPKPPKRVEDAKLLSLTSSKNTWDRSPVEADNPTASNGAPVPKDGYDVGNMTHLCLSQTCVDDAICNEIHDKDQENVTLRDIDMTLFNTKADDRVAKNDSKDQCKMQIKIENPDNTHRFYGNVCTKMDVSSRAIKTTREKRATRAMRETSIIYSHKSSSKDSKSRSWNNIDHHREDEDKLINNRCSSVITNIDRQECQKKSINKSQNCFRTKQLMKDLSKSCDSSSNPIFPLISDNRRHARIEDSGYLSSTDSNGSHKWLLKHDVSSVSETDETESVCDGASESGAESIGTDSVFFGNFHRFSDKSENSAVHLTIKSSCIQPCIIRNDNSNMERTYLSTSDSETESFITVLPPCSS